MKTPGSVLLAGLIALTLLVIWIVPVWAQIALFGGVVLFLLIHFEAAGPLHPAAWFSVFCFLYSVNYPLFLLTTGQSYTELPLILPLNFLALTGFLVGLILTSSKPMKVPVIPWSAGALRTIILVIMPICAWLVYSVMTSGIGSKREFIDTARQSGTDSLFLFFQVITVAYIAYALRLLQTTGADRGLRHSFFTLLGLSVLAVQLLSFGATGERDIILRMGLLIYLCLMAMGRGPAYRFWHFILIGFAGVYLVGILQGLKGFLLGDGAEAAVGTNQSIFWNEFAAAGRNLDYILSRNIARLDGESYVWAVMRYFDFIFPDAMSATQWYNTIVRNDFGDGGTSGWGFSLVAEAFINFGPIGIFIAFLFIGLLAAMLYRAARGSAFGFLFYLLFIPTTIYALRADAGNLLTTAFKVNLALVGGVWLIAKCLDLAVRRPREGLALSRGAK
ncbi:MAG: O-antigen polymerase [Novosphingobium sp.]